MKTKNTYKLYYDEKPLGIELAIVNDEQQANILESYYREVYDNDKFLVTVKKFRKKEERLLGNWN